MKDSKVNTTIVIGELIKKELKSQGKTTVWLAKQLGCHRTNIYKVYGRQLLDVDFFKLYSDALAKQKK